MLYSNIISFVTFLFLYNISKERTTFWQQEQKKCRKLINTTCIYIGWQVKESILKKSICLIRHKWDSVEMYTILKENTAGIDILIEEHGKA